MTNEEAIEILQSGAGVWPITDRANNAVNKAIKALEQESCEDTISRQEVQDLFATWLSDYLTDETREVLETIDGKVGDMPSVTPKQRTGHWINHINELFPVESEIECSECGHKQTLMIDDNFCPQCGAKMEG